MAKKTNLVKVLTALMVGAMATGAGVANLSASAENKTLGGVDISSFRMEYGASVRFNAPDGKNGIRFKATMTDMAYSDLEALEETEGTKVNYGVIIVPADLYSADKLTVENIFGSGKYCLENTEECSCEKTHLATVKYEELGDSDAGDGLKNLWGSLTDILSSNLTREFTGIGYIEYVTTTGTNYAMAEYAFDENGEGEATIKNTTRSMTYVAQKAIVKGEDKNDTIYNSYVSSLTNKEFKYTVNHYLPDENGNYGDPVSETTYGYLNSTVTAVNIAKSSLEDKADYAEYATYGVATNSKSSDLVYANGKTVLNNYYVARNTVLFDGSSASDLADLKVAYDKSMEAGNMKAAAVLSQGESYTDANGVSKSNLTKLVLDGEQETYGAGYVKFAVADEKVALANSANWDYLTVTMCIETNVAQTSLNMYSKNAFLGSVAVNEWVDFVIPKSALNTKKSYLGTDFGTKDLVDTAFANQYAVSKQDNQKNFTHNLFYTNTVKNTQAGTYVNYYIEKITWGVDVKAPEISGSNAKIFTEDETVNYIPSVVVSDDYNGAPNTIYEMYSVNGVDNRTLMEATDGSYTLTKTNEYLLVVKANDACVSDISGNITIKEYPVRIVSVADGLTFESDAENTYLKNGGSAWAGVTSTVGEWNDSVTFGANTAKGVLSYHADCSETKRYGGYLHLGFSQDQIADILSKFYLADGTVNPDFKLVFDMAVSLECLSDGATVYLVNKNTAGSSNGPVAQLTNNVWTTVEIPSSKLVNEGWTSTANITKILNGTSSLWYIQNETIPVNNAGALTYYFDSISWTGTAE